MKRFSCLALLATLATISSAQNLTVIANASGGSDYNTNSKAKGPLTASSTSGQQGYHHGESIADYGVLKAFGTSIAGGENPFAYHFGSATAKFEDTLTFTNTETSDTWGYVTFKWRVDGTLAAQGSYETSPGRFDSNRAGAHMTLTLNGSGESRVQTINGRGVKTSTRNGEDVTEWIGTGEHSTTVAVTFGQAADLLFSLYAFGETTTRDGGSATADLGHSAYWGGIASVTDPSGHALNYSLSSLSGHDWTQPSVAAVPEPMSMATLGIGAFGLLRRRRR